MCIRDSLWMIHVRVNANLKSFTVEELEGRKKEMHLAAFKYMLSETERALAVLAEELDAQGKLEKDTFKTYNLQRFLRVQGGKESDVQGMIVGDEIHFTVNGLIQKLVAEGASLRDRHAALAQEVRQGRSVQGAGRGDADVQDGSELGDPGVL